MLQKKDEKREESEKAINDKQDIKDSYETHNLPIDTVVKNDELSTINSDTEKNDFSSNNDLSNVNREEFNGTYDNSVSNTNTKKDDNRNDTYQYSNINFNTDDDNKFNNMF